MSWRIGTCFTANITLRTDIWTNIKISILAGAYIEYKNYKLWGIATLTDICLIDTGLALRIADHT